MAIPPLLINSLRGGLNDKDTPGELMDDQCTAADNMDFNRSTCGGRRLGSQVITLTTSGFVNAVVWLFRHLPSVDERLATLWGMDSTGAFAYKDTAWHPIVPKDLVSLPTGLYQLDAVSAHGKMFVAFPSGQDRLHVFDGTNFRRVGFPNSIVAPTGANTAGAGAYTGTRYARVRFTEQVGGATVRRSEPSAVLTFAPSGANVGATFTRPAALTENETHWEIELSTDNANFYRMSTIILATTTYADTVAFATGYATTGTLSDSIGDYLAPYSPKFLGFDEDRLLMAGAWAQPALASRISWTPVFGATGVGNDERIPTRTSNYLDLDNYDGGELTDFEGPLNGYWYAFKRKRIYKFVRRGVVTQAYEAFPITDSWGAMPRSAYTGVDEFGRPAIYFLDPDRGPARICSQGIQYCGWDVNGTWKNRLNKDADLTCHGLFYEGKQQMWWWLAADGNITPTIKIVAHVNEFRSDQIQGARRGWSVHTGGSCLALTSCLFASNIDANTNRSLNLVPFIGVASGTATKLVQRCDVTGVFQDDGVPYQSRMRTKPFTVGSLVRKVGATLVAIMAKAGNVTINVALIKDNGTEANLKTANFTPTGVETRVIKAMDDLVLSDMLTLELELGDNAGVNVDWELDRVAVVLRDEGDV